MKGFKMYKQIQQLKEIGFTRSRAAKQLNINRETVTQYKHWYFGHFHMDKNIDEKHTLVYNRIIKIN